MIFLHFSLHLFDHSDVFDLLYVFLDLSASHRCSIWTAYTFIEYSIASRVDSSFITNHAFPVAIRLFPSGDDSHVPIYRIGSKAIGEQPSSRSMIGNQTPYIASCELIPRCFGLQILVLVTLKGVDDTQAQEPHNVLHSTAPDRSACFHASIRAYLAVLVN